MATRAEIEARMAAMYPETAAAPAAASKRTRAQIEAEMAARTAPVEPTPEEVKRAEAIKRVEGYRQEEEGNSFLENAWMGAKDVIPDLYRGVKQASAEQRQQIAQDDIMGVNQPTGRLAALGFAPKSNAAGRYIEAGDERRELNAEEEANRERMQFIDKSAGGITGNIGANIALTAPLGLARGGLMLGQGARALALGRAMAPTAARATGLTGAELLGANVAKEGGIGALMGAATPTVEGESRSNNAMVQGLLGTVIPAVGGAVKSKGGQQAADWILGNTPGFIKSTAKRLDKTARGEYDAEVGPMRAANKAEAEQFAKDEKYKLTQAKALNEGADIVNARATAAAKQEADHADYLRTLRSQEAEGAHAAEVAAAKETQAKAASDWEVSEANRVATANQLREGHFTATREQLFKDAGFEKAPIDQIAAKGELAKVGNRLGEIVKPYPVPTDKFVEATKKYAKEWGTDTPEANKILKIGQSVHDKTDLATGKMPGVDYSAMRREIIDAMSDARGTYRTRLNDMLDDLDDSFDAVAPKEVVDSLKTTRSQYAVGHRVANAAWDPTTGTPKLTSALTRLQKLSQKSDSQGATQRLADALRLAPPEVKAGKAPAFDLPPMTPPTDLRNIPQPRPAEVPPPRRFAPEAPGTAPTPRDIPSYTPITPDYDRAGKTATLAAMLMGPGAAALPVGAGLLKAGNNKEVRKYTAMLLRALNAGYGSNLAPGGEDGIPLNAPLPEKNIRVTHGKKQE